MLNHEFKSSGPARSATKHAERSPLSEGQQAYPHQRGELTRVAKTVFGIWSMCSSTARRSLQWFFWKARGRREGRQQWPAVEQASEANDELLSLSFLLLTLEVLQSLFGLNCAGIRNNRAVISQSG